MVLIIRIAFFSLFLLVQGCTTSPQTHQHTLEALNITAPLAINYKYEVAIAQLTQNIQRADISTAQRAQLYFQRGSFYDKVGLKSLAFFDFKHSLKLNPALVEAYNLIGIHATLSQQFTQAFNAFDSALELEPSYKFAYLNRGVSLYYAGRPNLAVEDLSIFLSFQPDDPYNAIWLYFSELADGNTEAYAHLVSRKAVLSDEKWPNYIVDLFLGKLSEDELLALASDTTNSDMKLIEKLCEAYFYLAKLSMFNGNDALAEKYFNLALSTNVYEFVEHRYAKLELDLLRLDKIEQVTE